MADNNLEILIVQAMLDKTVSTANIKKDLLEISKMIGSLKLSVNIDNAEFVKLANSVEILTRGMSGKKIEIIDKSQIQEGQKLFATLQDVKNEYAKLGQIKVTNESLNPITKELQGFSIAVTNADNKVEKLKFDLLTIADGDKISQMFSAKKLTQTDPIAANLKASDKAQEEHLISVRKNLLQEENEWNDFYTKQKFGYDKYLSDLAKQDISQSKLGTNVGTSPKFGLDFKEAQDYAKTLTGVDAELRNIGYSVNSAGEKIQTLNIQTKEGGKYQKDWTATLNQATGQTHLFEKGLSDVATRSLGFVEALKAAMVRLPTFLLAGAVVGGSLGFITDGIKYVNEFNATLTQIGTAVNYSQGKLASLGQQFQELAKNLHASTAEISSAGLEFYRQGLNDDQVLERLKTVTEYSKISGLAFQQSADLLTAATNTTKLDINQIADVFTLLGDKTATSAAEIGKSFQKVGATAESLQIPFEKVSAMIATVSAQTRQAPELIGSAINSIFSRVESVRKTGFDSADGTTINQVSQSLEKAGVALTDANGQFRNFSTVLDELAVKWGSLDTVTRRYVATTVAGTRNQTQ